MKYDERLIGKKPSDAVLAGSKKRLDAMFKERFENLRRQREEHRRIETASFGAVRDLVKEDPKLAAAVKEGKKQSAARAKAHAKPPHRTEVAGRQRLGSVALTLVPPFWPWQWSAQTGQDATGTTSVDGNAGTMWFDAYELVEIGTRLRRRLAAIRLTDMRGDERDQDGMFSYISLEHRVPQDHPLRAVRKLTDAVLRTLSPEFDVLYADSGRPSIAPEYILRALLLQVFYSVRSERLLVEQIDYNLLFRWFVGLGMDDAVWNHAVFSKNRDRLLTSDVAQRFFAEVNKQAKKFMSDEHFTVDGTLIQAWASQKSFRSKDGSDDDDGTDFRGQKRSNDTHQSSTDPDARLYKKSYGKESKLSYLGHALVENRNGLIAAAMVTHADGYAERDAALLMLAEKQKGRSRRITVGADKAYDTKDFVSTVRELNVTPHVTKNDKSRTSNLDRRTTRQPGYAISLSRRWLIEKGFGWLKQTGPLRQVKLRGLEKVDWLFVFSCAVHNLIRLPRLMAQPPDMLREKCA